MQAVLSKLPGVGANAVMPILIIAAGSYLAWCYRDSFRPMLRADAKPHGHDEAPAPKQTADAAA